MKLAIVYAGQGSQHPGMGRDVYEAFPAFREAFDAAREQLGFDLHKVCFEDPDGVLNETQYTQPCMVAFAAGITAVLQQAGIRADYLAGLSLGEYSALQAAGVFDPAQAVLLAECRGKAMAKAAEGVESAMIAVLGLGREALAECCEKASALGTAQICNLNCPGQIVIGGEKNAVQEAGRLALQAGAKRCLPLKVSGPFHTRLMAPAGEALRQRFQTEHFGELRTPVLFNCLGREKTEQESIPGLLIRQVQSSVYMEDTLRRLGELGVDRVIEVGPGKALTGFVKKTLGTGVQCTPVETAAELQALLDEWKGAGV